MDVVVNNAGINHVEPATVQSGDVFREELQINLIAPFDLARMAAAAMIDAGIRGSIVNIASVWGLAGVGQIPDAGYAASKSGLIGMTRELAAQWARSGVRVQRLGPRLVRQRDDRRHDVRRGSRRAAEQWMNRRTPMGRGGEEHELDGALLFLASDASSYVTGTVVVVDGGWTAI